MVTNKKTKPVQLNFRKVLDLAVSVDAFSENPMNTNLLEISPISSSTGRSGSTGSDTIEEFYDLIIKLKKKKKDDEKLEIL